MRPPPQSALLIALAWTGQISWATTATDSLTKRLPSSTNTVRRSPPSAVSAFLLAALSPYVPHSLPGVARLILRKFVEGLPRFWSYFYDILPKLRLTHFSTDL